MTDDRTTPELAGLHHLKYAVSDLELSLRWWEVAFGAKRQEQWDHVMPDGQLFAYLLVVPGLPCPVELRLAPGSAAALGAFDPVTMGVDTEAELNAWADHLDAVGIRHSGVLRGISGWVLVTRTPDGTSVRLYSHELHGWDADHADADNEWTRPLARDVVGSQANAR